MKRLILFLVLGLVLTMGALADDPVICTDNIECDHLGPDFICDIDIFTCVDSSIPLPPPPAEAAVDNGTTSSVIPPIPVNVTDSLESNVSGDNLSMFDGESDFDEGLVGAQIAVLNNRFVVLDGRVSELSLENDNLEITILALNQQIQDIESIVGNINGNLQLLSLEQRNAGNNLDTALAGLATLQQEIQTTQTEITSIEEDIQKKEARTEMLRLIALITIFLVVFGSLTYYMLAHGKHRTRKGVSPSVQKYITGQIKKGKNYASIRKELLAKGWSVEDIKTAYKETSEQNYEHYLESSGKKKPHSIVPKQNSKIIIASVLSIVIIGILVLFVGGSVGKATSLPSDMNSDSYSQFVNDAIENRIENNLFYSTVDFLDLCVQVNNGELTSSHRIIKTNFGHAVMDASIACDSNPGHDFAIKFPSWGAFDLLTEDLSCVNIVLAHAAQNVVVLPSTHIAQGFNQQGDYSEFCATLQVCMTPQEIALTGLNC